MYSKMNTTTNGPMYVNNDGRNLNFALNPENFSSVHVAQLGVQLLDSIVAIVIVDVTVFVSSFDGVRSRNQNVDASISGTIITTFNTLRGFIPKVTRPA